MLGQRSRNQSIAFGLIGSLFILAVVPITSKPLFTVAIPADVLDIQLLTMVRGASVVHVDLPRDRWIAAYGIVLALDRLGIDFRVEKDYAFLYGERRIASPAGRRQLQLIVSASPCRNDVRLPDFGYGST